MQKVTPALKALAKSPAVQKEVVILLRIAATVLAAKYGLNAHF